MNEVFFSGYGYFQVDTDDFDKAEDMLLKALADAGIDLNIEEIELRDENGEAIE